MSNDISVVWSIVIIRHIYTQGCWENVFLTNCDLKKQIMNVGYKKYYQISKRPNASCAIRSWNCAICSCLLNYKILKDGEMKSVIISKIHRLEVKLT